MAYDPTNVVFENYDCTWNAQDLGGVDDVAPDFKAILTAIKIGSAGAMKLDDRFEGLGDDAQVGIIVREPTLARIRTLSPWDNGSGAVDLTPPIGTKLYQYAQALVLHPRNKGVATTDDVKLYKTVPVGLVEIPRDGVKPVQWKVIFFIYPDQAKVASGVSAYGEVVGA